MIESGSLGCFKPTLLPSRLSPRYKATNLTSSCFEETCANGYAREKTWATSSDVIPQETEHEKGSIDGSAINQAAAEASNTASWKSISDRLCLKIMYHSIICREHGHNQIPRTSHPSGVGWFFVDWYQFQYILPSWKNSPRKRLPLDVRTLSKQGISKRN